MRTVYVVDDLRVFTGEVKELELSAPIQLNWIMSAPPAEEGFHIWDGYKWFSRAAYPYPAPPSPSAVMTPLQFLRLLTLEERGAVRTAALTDPVLEDALFLLQAAQNIDLYDSDTQRLLDYLVQQGLLSEARRDEVYANAQRTI